MRNNPLSLREQHTHKSADEKREYELFISRVNGVGTDKTEVEEEKKKDEVEEEPITLIGEKKKEEIEETNKAKEKQKTIDTKDLTPRKKKTRWEHFKNRWHRKWADNLVDLIFNFGFWIITTILTTLFTALATYFITKNSFEKDLSEIKSQVIEELKQENIKQLEHIENTAEQNMEVKVKQEETIIKKATTSTTNIN